jgi:hypothetical protein
VLTAAGELTAKIFGTAVTTGVVRGHHQLKDENFPLRRARKETKKVMLQKVNRTGFKGATNLLLKNTKLRVAVLAVLFTLILAAGAHTAHAQGFCQRVQAHPAGDIRMVPGPYGWYEAVFPCVHWITICN